MYNAGIMDHAITILTVDDNFFMREILRMIISRQQNFKLVAEATSGLEAINMARQYMPDVVLIDINMAPINGFEATRKILKYNPLIKIIGLSMHKQPSYARNIIQLGAKGYLTKSSPHQEIVQAINTVYQGNQYVCLELAGQL
jgi:two-component system, NarL family, invasion response regulator UvrY